MSGNVAKGMAYALAFVTFGTFGMGALAGAMNSYKKANEAPWPQRVFATARGAFIGGMIGVSLGALGASIFSHAGLVVGAIGGAVVASNVGIDINEKYAPLPISRRSHSTPHASPPAQGGRQQIHKRHAAAEAARDIYPGYGRNL